ncbi:MAG: guanylate kinase, partial [Desulfotignum sp.]
RLETRGTDSRQTIDLRLENARLEISQKHLYQHLLVNDDLETAAAQLCAIFDREMTGDGKKSEGDNA